MIKVGIIGGAGYTAGELIRLLLNHPDVEIQFVNSSSNAGNKIVSVHEGLYGETDLVFTDELPLDEIDVLFFCTAHGDTRKFMESHQIPEGLKLIDLSMDYRLKSDDHDFIYGLPELNRRICLPYICGKDRSPQGCISVIILISTRLQNNWPHPIWPSLLYPRLNTPENRSQTTPYYPPEAKQSSTGNTFAHPALNSKQHRFWQLPPVWVNKYF